MKKFLAALMAALGVTLFSCTRHESIHSVIAEEFERAVLSSRAQLLDVRTAAEYAQGHIAGAVNIDMHAGDFKKRVMEVFDRSRPLLIYCRSGHRSRTAASWLASIGFRLINLKGGIIEWEQAGFRVSPNR